MAETTPIPPEELDPTFRGFLTGHSQTPLAYVRWEHPDPKGRLVLSHGYGEHSERYRHTAKWLHDLGWSVSAMDHRGFGRSGGRRGDASGIRAFVEDLALFLRHERNHDRERVGAGPRIVDGIPVSPLPVCPQVLLGHSFGGLVAVLDLLWHVDTLDGLILTSPGIALRPMGLMMKLLQGLFLLVAPHKPLDLPNDKILSAIALPALPSPRLFTKAGTRSFPSARNWIARSSSWNPATTPWPIRRVPKIYGEP